MTTEHYDPSRPHFYGRRVGKPFRPLAKAAYEGVLPSLTFDPLMLNDQSTPWWMEIGFGGGEHLLWQLQHNPGVNILGCEPFKNGVAQLLKNLTVGCPERLRIFHDDVRLLLPTLPSAVFEKIFILFPDPWPKKRHHKRRLLQPDFIHTLCRLLKPGGMLMLATDDPAYLEHMIDVTKDHPLLLSHQPDISIEPHTWPERPMGPPITRYEQKGLDAGRKGVYQSFQKRP